MDTQLEMAMMFAEQGEAPLDQLKAIARTECDRADRFGHLISHILSVTGPVSLSEESVARRSDGFTITTDDCGKVTFRSGARDFDTAMEEC